MTQQIPNTNIGGQFQYNVAVPLQRVTAFTSPTTTAGFSNGDEWFNTVTKNVYVFRFGAWVLLSFNPTPPQSISWVQVNGSQGTAPNTAYSVVSGATQISLALPLTSNFGDMLFFQGQTTAIGPAPASPGFIITQGSGQQIFQDNTKGTTSGPSGYLAITSQGAYVALLCVTPNLIWDILPTSNGSMTAH